MVRRFTVILVVILILLSFVAGFLLSSSRLLSEDQDEAGPVKHPEWETGLYWVYAYSTPDIDQTIARVVVAEIEGDDYLLGIESRLDAQRHAVLNYNPMLGRITKDNLGVYEEGEPQTVLLFPMEKGNTWKFDFLGLKGWDAKVRSVERVNFPGMGMTTLAQVEATASSGEVLTYTYDSSARWFRTMVLTDTGGEEALSMTLVSYGIGYTGDVYFIRGLDLYESTFTSSRGSPEVDVYDTFLDQGHPSWGPFDDLIYYYRVDTGSSSHAVLIIKDHSSTTTVRRTFQSGVEGTGLGVIGSNAGEWGVSVLLQGNCKMDIIIAGGIEYVWTL